MTRRPIRSRSRAWSVPLVLVRVLVAVAPTTVQAATSGLRSPDGVWRPLGNEAVFRGGRIESFALPAGHRVVELNDFALFSILRRAPLEHTAAAMPSSVVLTLPMPDGTFSRFRIAESPMLSDRLAAEHPEIRTYLGQGIDEPTQSVRFDRTPLGFHALVVTPDDFVLVQRGTGGTGNTYVTFRASELALDGAVSCHVEPSAAQELLEARAAPPAGATLRTYDTAIVTTDEFTAYYGSANILAAVTSHLNTVNAIFEREVAIRLELSCLGAYDTGGNDPFPDPLLINSYTTGLADQVIDNNCGPNNYEVGHLFHFRPGGGWGGWSTIGSICTPAAGQSVTVTGDPGSPAWLLEGLPHEMGHAFNANHIYNSTAGGCVQRLAQHAYEIGAGTTIMSYACAGCWPEAALEGRCADSYYNSHNFDEITAYREGLGSCGELTLTGNTPPTVGAGPDYRIPRGTSFKLTATGHDDDGDALTYCWEQHDRGPASPPLNGGTRGPLFRSFPPTTDPTRTFPSVQALAYGPPFPNLEILPTVDRSLSFRVTVRDNRAGGGGVNYDTVNLIVEGDPFHVDVPNGGEAFATGCPLEVSWTVGGGSTAPGVNILLSTDGGLTFPTTLAENVPNDGAQVVTLPGTSSAQARIRVEAVGNIFFDQSDEDFRIAAPEIAVSLDRTSLWPPNHRLVDITANVRMTNGCPGTTFSLSSITSSEPEDEVGDGNTSPDVVGAEFGTPDVAFQLRAERLGSGNGRTYTVTYAVTGAGGNTGAASIDVRVAPDLAAPAAPGVPRVNAPSGALGATAEDSSPSLSAVQAVTRLAGVRPNPFLGETAVSFELARSARVTLEVYSPAGMRVRTLAARGFEAGRHAIRWDGRDDAGRRAPPGVFFVRFAADGTVNTEKALLLP